MSARETHWTRKPRSSKPPTRGIGRMVVAVAASGASLKRQAALIGRRVGEPIDVAYLGQFGVLTNPGPAVQLIALKCLLLSYLLNGLALQSA